MGGANAVGPTSIEGSFSLVVKSALPRHVCATQSRKENDGTLTKFDMSKIRQDNILR